MRELYTTMTNTSSMEEAASTSCGKPLLVPILRSMKDIISGTTTAGETAASTAPSSADSM